MHAAEESGGKVGWYSYMSQFGHKVRINVDVASIRSEMPDEAGVSMEVRLTCAHEYGHMIAEMLSVLKGQSLLLCEMSER